MSVEEIVGGLGHLINGELVTTGKTFESDILHMFTVRGGKVVQLLDFFDTAALAEAHRA